jgi:pimeloyl-ACP methyl ester carboxylesterase
MSNATLGYELVGSGSCRLIVLNDWFCDTSTWQDARAYLDQTRFSWAFADMRGYGRSRGQSDNFSVVEAASDVLSLADTLGWTHFSIVGHSMSTYVALHLGQPVRALPDAGNAASDGLPGRAFLRCYPGMRLPG